MAIYTIFLASGSLVGGLIGGYITSTLGWRWTCYIPAIMAGALFVLTFFFVPETLFDRAQAMAVVRDPDARMDEKEYISRVETVQTQVFPPYTFARSLKMGTYRPGLLKRIFTPYTTLLFPGTWMVMLHYAGLVGLIVTISTVAPQLLAAPPYLWGANVGLINVGGLIGTVLGAFYTYFTADWWAKRSAKKESHGYSEPEARLMLMFPALIIATAGSICFGFSANASSPKAWIGLEFGIGMVSFGLMQVPSIGFNYIIEAYGGWASDCCECLPFLRIFGLVLFTSTDSPLRSPHGRHLPRNHQFCMDLLRRLLDRERWFRSTIWYLRLTHGCLFSLHYPHVGIWKALPYCDSKAGPEELPA